MTTRILTKYALTGCLISLGCGGSTPTAGNTVLNAAPDEKAKIQDILKQYGITKEIVAVRDIGDHWQVSVAEPPPPPPAAGEKPKPVGLTGPEDYKVFKDGRVNRFFDDKPLTKK